MNESGFVALFQELGFIPTAKRALLRHPRGLPSIYFNVSRQGTVYFAVRAAHRQAFSRDLWSQIPPQQKKDDHPNLVTLIPREGREREAFASIVGWRA